MADNVPITPGTGADVATDDIGGKHHQRIKIVQGADGVSDGDVSSVNPLPVQVGLAAARGFDIASIDASSSGNNDLVAASGVETIKIYGWLWKVAGAVNVKFRDNANGADYCPALPFTKNGDGMIADPLGVPYFISAAGGDLKLNLSAAINVKGWVFYKRS